MFRHVHFCGETVRKRKDVIALNADQGFLGEGRGCDGMKQREGFGGGGTLFLFRDLDAVMRVFAL